MNLNVTDVTSDYINRWPGHFPFPYKVFFMNGADNCLIVITVEGDGFTIHPRPVVTDITIYSHR